MLVERIDKTEITRRQKYLNKWFEWPPRDPSILEVPDEFGKILTEQLPRAKYFRVFTGIARTGLDQYTSIELTTELARRSVAPSIEAERKMWEGRASVLKIRKPRQPRTDKDSDVNATPAPN